MKRGHFAVACALFFSGAMAFAELGSKDGAHLEPTDLNRIKIGDRAPDFTLEEINGRRISLSDFRGKKHIVLVFYRGHW